MTIDKTSDERTPDHYRGSGGVQPFDVIDAFDLDFYEGNAVKYLLRWRKKGGADDLRKARHYIDEILVREAERASATPPRCTCAIPGTDPGCPVHP